MSDISKVQQPLSAGYLCTAGLYKGYTLYLQNRNLLHATHTHKNTTTHMHMYRELGTKILYYIIRSNFLTCTYGTKLHITGNSVCDPDAVSTFSSVYKSAPCCSYIPQINCKLGMSSCQQPLPGEEVSTELPGNHRKHLKASCCLILIQMQHSLKRSHSHLCYFQNAGGWCCTCNIIVTVDTV